MFSIDTVASSTSTPTASASPPSVMMLMVCPVAHSRTTALSSANGMFITTISALRQSRRKISTIRPVSTAPSSPSMISPRMRVGDVGRLVEFQAHVHVVRQHFLEIGNRRLDAR